MEDTSATNVPLFQVLWDRATLSLSLEFHSWILSAFVLVILGILVWKFLIGKNFRKQFEIDEAEIGVGPGKIRFKPNIVDQQVAYSVWVELSTRKIGLPINFEHDVVAEVYDSWYHFFSVTRELIKGVPVSKIKGDSTQKIVKLSIEVLNEGLRPHLTKWQARFRRWHERELKRYDGDLEAVIDPQEIQAKFPKFEELKAEMMEVNARLIKYRKAMYDLVMM